jgi:hypothetical protein
MAKSHLIWLAFQVNVGDCQINLLMQIKDWLHPCPMIYDIFFMSTPFLTIGLEAQGLLATPFHILPMQKLRKVKNVGDNFAWGKGDGWCDYDAKNSDCECDLDSRVPCLIIRKVMHGS